MECLRLQSCTSYLFCIGGLNALLTSDFAVVVSLAFRCHVAIYGQLSLKNDDLIEVPFDMYQYVASIRALGAVVDANHLAGCG